jgi:hypothetical protein
VGQGVVDLQFPNGWRVNIRQGDDGLADVIVFRADKAIGLSDVMYLNSEELAITLERIRVLRASGSTAASLAPFSSLA